MELQNDYTIFGKKTESRRHAVVIGGSMAGMLAARVLSEHYDSVTIVERDRYPEEITPRPGVPQARHLHVLLAGGLRVLEELFPDITTDAIECGAGAFDGGADVAWLNPAGWGVKFESKMTALTFSRPLLDWVVIRRLRSIPNIRILEGHEVTELIDDDLRDRVIGVSLRQRGESAGDSASGKSGEFVTWMKADLVVETTGRTSRLPQFLKSLGYEAPSETVIDAHLGYASRIYRIPDNFTAGWKAIFLQAAPPDYPRAGILFPIEGNRWLLTVAGGDRDYPPIDEEGFLEFTRNLRSPLIYETIKDAKPLTPISGYRGTDNRRRHFERLDRWPRGLIAMGDSVCAFNPVYGQGMTIAAISARLLGEKLTANGGNLDGLEKKFQRRLAKIASPAWMLATGEDYRYRTVEGGSPSAINKFMHWYLDHLVHLTVTNPSVRMAFSRVQQMVEPPSTLFHPALAGRILLRALRKASGKLLTPTRRNERMMGGFADRPSPSKF